jgi:hypothetical protein
VSPPPFPAVVILDGMLILLDIELLGLRLDGELARFVRAML